MSGSHSQMVNGSTEDKNVNFLMLERLKSLKAIMELMEQRLTSTEKQLQSPNNYGG